MKKAIILVCGLLFTVASVNAQYNKMWISGTGSTSSTTTTPQGGSDNKSSSSEFGPVFGYNVNEMITIGLGLSYSTDISDPDGGPKTTTTGLNLMPFARYNKKAGDKLTIFGEFDLNIGSGTTKTDVSGSSEAKVSSFGIAVGPGLNYMLSDRFSVTAFWGALAYNSYDYKDSHKDTDFALGLNLNSLDFGLNYHFGK